MPTALRLLFLALLAGAAPADEIRLRVSKGLAAETLLKQLHQATRLPLLYAPADVAGRTTQGSVELVLPARHADAAVRVALATCDLEGQRLGGDLRLALVKPRNALATEFRLTGLATPLHFNRGPGGWTDMAEHADALTEETVQALRALLADGTATEKRGAALLLGRFGPRDRATVDALAAVLADAGARPLALAALAHFGYFARAALPAIERLSPAPKDVIRTIREALHPGLLNPAAAKRKAPGTFTVVLETTQGDIEIEVVRAWSPLGADRFYNLVTLGFYDDTAFFRMMPGFVAQFGLSGHHPVNRVWRNATIKDDPVKTTNAKGTLSFAKSDKDTRTTQVFINLGDNGSLDGMGFSPFGKITKGMKVVAKLYAGYGEQPDQGRIHFDGNAYLKKQFPRLDYIKRARIK